MRGTWVGLAALALVASGCGESPSGRTEPVSEAAAPASYDGPVVRPTAVPGADGPVTTSSATLVTDDGSGPWMCWSASIEFGGGGGPHVCDDARVTGWDWDTVGDSTTERGVRQGWFTLTGTFDGSTFAVEDATEPGPPPDDWDFEIPCPPPEGGWQVVDAGMVTQDDYLRATSAAQALDDYALVAVSTPQGEPGPRDPADTVVSVYVAGDPVVAEATVREVWGGMLCVTQVERSAEELEAIQQALLDLPGWSEIGAGTTSNKVEMTVFHDDGRYQQWVDREFGEGVVLVESILQPVG